MSGDAELAAEIERLAGIESRTRDAWEALDFDRTDEEIMPPMWRDLCSARDAFDQTVRLNLPAILSALRRPEPAADAVERPTICVGEPIIASLRRGEAVELSAAVLIPASDLAALPRPEPQKLTCAGCGGTGRYWAGSEFAPREEECDGCAGTGEVNPPPLPRPEADEGALVSRLTALRSRPEPAADVVEPLACAGGCGLLYSDPGWVDVHIPDETWHKIAPRPDGGGVLCLTCITRQLVAAGITRVPLTIGDEHRYVHEPAEAFQRGFEQWAALPRPEADDGALVSRLTALAGRWEAQALNREQYEPSPCFELRGCAQDLRAALAAAQEGAR